MDILFCSRYCYYIRSVGPLSVFVSSCDIYQPCPGKKFLLLHSNESNEDRCQKSILPLIRGRIDSTCFVRPLCLCFQFLRMATPGNAGLLVCIAVHISPSSPIWNSCAFVLCFCFNTPLYLCLCSSKLALCVCVSQKWHRNLH